MRQQTRADCMASLGNDALCTAIHGARQKPEKRVCCKAGRLDGYLHWRYLLQK